MLQRKKERLSSQQINLKPQETTACFDVLLLHSFQGSIFQNLKVTVNVCDLELFYFALDGLLFLLILS